MRTHFTGNAKAALEGSSTHTVQDAFPAAALFVGTWGYAQLTDDSDGRREAFAIGTVLAESGNDDYRWLRRVLGYGAAGFTGL